MIFKYLYCCIYCVVNNVGAILHYHFHFTSFIYLATLGSNIFSWEYQFIFRLDSWIFSVLQYGFNPEVFFLSFSYFFIQCFLMDLLKDYRIK